MPIHTIPTQTHGRFIVDAPVSDGPLPMLVGFHGYAERAEDMRDRLRQIRGERAWLLVSVQGLNRFYTRAQTIVANWMTREDRELAIADNIAYVAGVVNTVRRDYATSGTIVYVGFSQGVAMAYRAAAFAADRGPDVPRASGAIVLAGDIPPDVVPELKKMPPVLIGRGTKDDWYTEAKASVDLGHFAEAHMAPAVEVFEGGHVWHETFLAAANRFIGTLEQLHVTSRPNGT